MNKEKELGKLRIGEKRGYLKDDFEIFHIKDQRDLEFDYHHHDFNKIVLFLSGRVTYHVEDKAYELKPWDLLIIGNTSIHKPVIDSSEVYERIVLWVYPEFLEKNNSSQSNLLDCFNKARTESHHLIRIPKEERESVEESLSELIALKDNYDDFGEDILKRILFLRFIVYINRLFIKSPELKDVHRIIYDENISAILSYINNNLQGDLSIDALSRKFYLSRYYLMHKFKEVTGSSLYSYIIQKRLIRAKELMKEEMSITEVASLCGFKDYSSFVRAFKKAFKMPPREYCKSFSKNVHRITEIENIDF